MSAGAGGNPPGLAVLLGFRTSTYLLLVPEKTEKHLSGKKQTNFLLLFLTIMSHSVYDNVFHYLKNIILIEGACF